MRSGRARSRLRGRWAALIPASRAFNGLQCAVRDTITTGAAPSVDHFKACAANPRWLGGRLRLRLGNARQL